MSALSIPAPSTSPDTSLPLSPGTAYTANIITNTINATIPPTTAATVNNSSSISSIMTANTGSSTPAPGLKSAQSFYLKPDQPRKGHLSFVSTHITPL
jgi:hypothetical protein